jgi:hypothetical protein
MERETLLGNIENSVEVLKGNIEGLPIEEIQARLDSLKTEADDFVGTASEERRDLFQKIEALKDGQISQGQVSESIQNALRDGTLSPDQINSALDNLRTELGEARATDIENLRAVTETGRADLSSQISALNNALEGRASAEELQALEKALGEQAEGLGDAGAERAEIIRQIGLLEEQGITQEDLEAALEGRASLADIENLQAALEGRASLADIEALRAALEGRASLADIEALRAALEGRASAADLESLRGDYQATGRLVEEALQTGQRQREGLQERVQALQAAQLDPASIQQQRATEIQAAVDPISQQIEALRGQMPQQIDVEALRKQITDEIMSQMPTVPTVAPNVSAGVGAGGEPFTGGSTGVNMSDGMADQMGFVPGGSVQDQIDFADNYQGRGGTRPAAPAAAPQVAVTPPPQVAVTPPPQVAVAPPPQVAATTPPPVAVAPPLQVAVAPPRQVAVAPPLQIAATKPPVTVAPPPPVQPIAGVASLPQQNLFDRRSLRFPNMRMR